MALRVYLSVRIGTGAVGDDDPFRCPLAQYARDNFDMQSRFQCISPCSEIVISIFDTTDAQDTQILANVVNTRSWLATFVRSTTIADLTVPQRNAISNYLTTRGFDVTWVVGATTLDAIINALVDSIRIAENVSARIGAIQTISAFHTKLRLFSSLTTEQKNAVRAFLAHARDFAPVADSETLESVADRLRTRLAPIKTDIAAPARLQ